MKILNEKMGMIIFESRVLMKESVFGAKKNSNVRLDILWYLSLLCRSKNINDCCCHPSNLNKVGYFNRPDAHIDSVKTQEGHCIMRNMSSLMIPLPETPLL